MTLPVPSFFALPAGNQPLSLLDQQFTAIAVTGALPCAAIGTNTLVLTPNTNVFVPTSYTTGLKVVWVQPVTTVAGAVTINVAGLGAISGFKSNGQTALGFNDLIGGCVYTGTFSSSLSSGNGGFAVDAFFAGSGAASVIISDTAPANPTNGLLWFDSVGALLYIYYTDPTSAQWVNVNNYGTGVPGTGGGGGGGGGGSTNMATVQGTFKNLSISVPSATTVTVAADAVVTFDGTNYFTIVNLSSTINAATNGANALDTGAIAQANWYAVWVISGVAGSAAMLSLSGTAPTMPSGYTARARVGWVRTAPTSANILKTLQLQCKVQYVITGTAPNTAFPLLFEGTSGTINGTTFTGTSLAVAPVVPPTAAAMDFVLSAGPSNVDVALAPNANFAGYQDPTNPVAWVMHGVASTNAVRSNFLLESTHVFYASSGAQGMAQCIGWEDNL